MSSVFFSLFCDAIDKEADQRTGMDALAVELLRVMRDLVRSDPYIAGRPCIYCGAVPGRSHLPSCVHQRASTIIEMVGQLLKQAAKP